METALQNPGDHVEMTLSERVDELCSARQSHMRLHSTTGTQAAIGRLAQQVEALERAIREVADAVEQLTPMATRGGARSGNAQAPAERATASSAFRPED